MPTAPSPYAAVVSARIEGGDQDLAARWLARLQSLVPVGAQSIFPSADLLDHIPALIKEIAKFLSAPEEDITANTFVTTKARELGALRHRQGASAHQLLREYELLRGILHTFVLEETERLELLPSASDVIRFMRRIDHAIGILTTVTVDTFIQAYSDTIEEQTRRLESFNRMVSHELRQPIGVLHMAARVLRMAVGAADDEKRDKALTAIERNLMTLTDLLETITRVSQTRRAEAPNDPGTQIVSVSAVATDAARQLREMADTHHVDIRVSPQLPSVTVDVGQLELMLTNLLSNAIKYSDPAKPSRFVEVMPFLIDRAYGFQVRDNGLGMNADQVRHAFDPFYRGHADVAEGIGLGLTIVRDCVEAMGASVTIEAVPGEGTVFSVTLPASLSADRS
jgi:signal transduction histidine kinase